MKEYYVNGEWVSKKEVSKSLKTDDPIVRYKVVNHGAANTAQIKGRAINT